MTVRTALDGQLVVPFGVHKADWNPMSEEQLMPFLKRQAASMLELYGDARYPHEGRQAHGS